MGLTDIRVKLCASANIKFQRMSQRDDLLNDTRTTDKLIETLWYITRLYSLMITACVSDHSDDSGLGEHCHRNGYCIDCWPIYVSQGNWEYIPADVRDFATFLIFAKGAPNLHEIGLAGTAYTSANMLACTGCSDVFEDDGADHIHLGVH